MQLIVLGVLPGTNTQITFEHLVNIGALIALSFLLLSFYKHSIRTRDLKLKFNTEAKTLQLVSARVNQFLLNLS